MGRSTVRSWALAALVSFGCGKTPQGAESVSGTSATTAQATAAQAPTASATASVASAVTAGDPRCLTTFRTPVVARELVVTVEIENKGAAALSLNALAIESSSLALELMGSDGKRFHDGPPPTPPMNMPTMKLGPGEKLTRKYELPNLSLAPGKYKLAFLCPNHAEQVWQDLVILGG